MAGTNRPTAKSTPIQQIIEENYRKFVADPDYLSTRKAMDQQKLHKATSGLKEKIASFLNFYVLQRSMKVIKIARGTLSEESEKELVERGRNAVKTCRSISFSIAAIGEVMANCGFDKVIDRHIGPLCEHLNYNPKLLPELQEIKDTGITDAEISCVFEELRKHDYNLFRWGGANGTLAGFVGVVKSRESHLEEEQKLLEDHGLPALEAAGGGCNAYCQAGIAAGIAAIACLFFYV